YINETIESVLNQTYKNWELIIVDDCSTDSTEEIIKDYVLNDSRIKYCKLTKNSGAAVARNKGIELSKGKYLSFLDSDDIWNKKKLSIQIKYMEENDINFTCTSYNKISESGEPLNQIISPNSISDYDGILKKNPGNSTVIYNCHALGKFKIPNIKKRNDYVLWLKVIKKAKYLYGIKETLSSHRLREGSLSSEKISLIKYHWIVYRKYEGLSVGKSISLILHYVFVSILKKTEK